MEYIIGKSKSLNCVLTLIDKVKDVDTPVFIWGESGTGKELVAKIIHFSGKRNSQKFVALNCGAVPGQLLESELFGYARGAFTGAMRDKPGLLEEAEGGTFFLDEIGDLSLNLQAKLLRVIQEKEFRRVGENRIRNADVRFISATNKVIENEISKGNFRDDLYYRLKIISIEIPALRDRKDDIPYLVDYFLEKYSQEFCRDKIRFSLAALELLLNYSWPGNIRELQNEIQRCLILCRESNIIGEEILSSQINPQNIKFNDQKYDFFRAKAEFEKRYINQALSLFNYNRAQTAQNIGLSRQGLFKLIKKHDIEIPAKK